MSERGTGGYFSSLGYPAAYRRVDDQPQEVPR
jgi:hypothetical protein